MNPDSPQRIRRLPEILSNQIAAGEVIERPASIVKELVENSLDAGARSVDIQIERGGTRMVRVQDDGSGIHPEDMRLALESHATSKLHTTEDLLSIRTLGFRGEALSSIAAVARISIISRTGNSNTAWSIGFDPVTRDYKTGPAAHPAGTTVTVSNLFYSIPARKKFLRSERTEFIYILETVKRLALSAFDTAVRLQHNGRVLMDCRDTASPDNRVRDLLGQAFIDNAVELDYRNDSLRLWGWIGDETMHRSQVDRQYLYHNNRIIRDRKLNHAIRIAYAEKIPPGRYPVYVLYLEMDPSLADVNVHPAKHEIRFRETREVHDCIHGCIQKALSGQYAGMARIAPITAVTGSGSTCEDIPGIADVREFTRDYHHHVPKRGSYTTGDSPQADTRFLGSVRNRYVLAEHKECLLLIDVAGARKFIARTRIEKLGMDESLVSRPLLVPVSIHVPYELSDPEGGFQELCRRFGLQLDYAGPRTILLRTIPLILEEADLQRLLEDILEYTRATQWTGRTALSLKLSRILEHHASSGSSCLDQGSMNALLHQLVLAGLDLDANTCPGIWRCLDCTELAEIIERGV